MNIGIVGLGYVGLPLAMEFADAGHEVIGVDVDARQGRRRCATAARTSRTCPTRGSPRARSAARSAPASPTCTAADAVLICVPTPLTSNREPELGPLLSAARALERRHPRGPDRSCSSRRPSPVRRATTSCRCSRSRACARARTSRSRSRPSASTRAAPTTRSRTTPKIVGGLTPACTERAAEIYAHVCERVVPVGTPEVGGDGEAAGEHLPLGQHRARQRDGDARRPHGHRHLGGRRRGLDEAVRLHALRAGAGHGRALPAGRSRST